MYDIRHRVGIKAPQHRVYEMLATKEGLAGFWSIPEGDSTVESPDERVRWRVVDGVPEWVGTTLTFELKQDGGETVLLFTHADGREPTEILHHSSTKWATYLIGLRSGLEGGSFTAFPHDTPVSSVWR